MVPYSLARGFWHGFCPPLALDKVREFALIDKTDKAHQYVRKLTSCQCPADRTRYLYFSVSIQGAGQNSASPGPIISDKKLSINYRSIRDREENKERTIWAAFWRLRAESDSLRWVGG